MTGNDRRAVGRPTRRVTLIILAAAGLLGGSAACARQGSPTGGPDDRRPPVVVSVEPDTFAVVEPGVDRLRIRFNERISERPSGGTLDDVIQIAPAVPELKVGHKRTGLDVEIPGGLRPGVAYTIRVLPDIQDMFGNRMAGPFEWAVSTGADFTSNAVVGLIWDRATGDPVQDVTVSLIPRAAPAGPDTLRWIATSGTDGLYALRILPEGPFRLDALLDVNRNGEADYIDPFGASQGELGPADTLFLSVPVLAPDTTPATLAQLEVVDSLVLRLLFDDRLDPALPLEDWTLELVRDTAQADLAAEPADPDAPADTALAGVAAQAAPADTAVVIPGIAQRFHEFAWAAYRDSIVAEADSAWQETLRVVEEAGDTLALDSLRTLGRSPVPGEEDRGFGGEGFRAFATELPDGSPVPSASAVLLLDAPLPAGVSIRVVAAGVVNLNGLPDGGGEVTGSWVAPVDSSFAADSLALDTLGLDTLGLDTLGLPGDTVAADTLGVADVVFRRRRP